MRCTDEDARARLFCLVKESQSMEWNAVSRVGCLDYNRSSRRSVISQSVLKKPWSISKCINGVCGLVSQGMNPGNKEKGGEKWRILRHSG
jgi:hypothetical protein